MFTPITIDANINIHGDSAKLLPTKLPSDIELLLYQYQEIHSHNGKILSGSTFIDRLIAKAQKQLIHGTNAERLDFLARCAASIASRTQSLIKKTRSIGKQKCDPHKISTAVLIGGSVGDFIQQLPFLEQLFLEYPTLEMHLYCRKEKLGDQTNLCFRNLDFIKEILNQDDLTPSNYDLLINLRHIVKFEIQNTTKIEHISPSLIELVDIATSRFKPFSFIYESHPHLDGLFGRLMAKLGLNAAEAACYFGGLNSCDITPSLCPEEKYIDAPFKFGLFEKKYITVHDGFDINNNTQTKRVTKQWPKEYWEKLISSLKENFPNITIVQIGAPKTSSPINNVDISLIGKTNLHEVAWLIKGALLHVDGESGLTRLAWAFGTPEICIQGPSATNFFSFGKNINLHPSGCKDCWWIKDDWFSFCIRGQQTPECMASIKPSQVYALAANIILHTTENKTNYTLNTSDASTQGLIKKNIYHESQTAKKKLIINYSKIPQDLAEKISCTKNIDTLSVCGTESILTVNTIDSSRTSKEYNLPYVSHSFDTILLIGNGTLSAHPQLIKELTRILNSRGTLFIPCVIQHNIIEHTKTSFPGIYKEIATITQDLSKNTDIVNVIIKKYEEGDET